MIEVFSFSPEYVAIYFEKGIQLIQFQLFSGWVYSKTVRVIEWKKKKVKKNYMYIDKIHGRSQSAGDNEDGYER